MSSSTLQAEIFINETNDGTVSSGYLEIVSSEDILIDSINADIHFEARGRMRGYKNTLVSFPIIVQPTLVKAHEETKLPFSFVVNNLIESYEGKNVNFTYSCEVTMHVNKEDFKKLGLSFLSSVKSFMSSDRRLRTLKEFEVKNRQNALQIQEGTFDLKLDVNFKIPIVIALLLFLLYMLFVPEFNIGYIIFGIVVIIASTFSVHSYLKSSLGKLTMKLEDDDENFRCTIGKTRNFNLKEQTLYYEVIEKVTDRRGTKTSTSIETVYTSGRKAMTNFKRNAEFSFPYVNNPDLASMKIDDVEILWRMTITGVSNLGLKLKYTCDFKVTKDKALRKKDGLVTF